MIVFERLGLGMNEIERLNRIRAHIQVLFVSDVMETSVRILHQ